MTVFHWMVYKGNGTQRLYYTIEVPQLQKLFDEHGWMLLYIPEDTSLRISTLVLFYCLESVL